jgi:serine/threonine protein kinase
VREGTRLGRYEIRSVLGRGGMGEVWRARDTKLNRDIAIKMLPERFSQDAQRLVRLEREARLLASINHPSIAVLYEFEQTSEATFLALELVEGETLAERLACGPIEVREALKIALQIAEALEAAHERGVIHRDLKPANIKITPNGKVKVLDFGLAKYFDQADEGPSRLPTPHVTVTQVDVILGTAAYMAPEQARGEAVDARADVWAFGCVLFEMLAARQAFAGDTMSDLLAAVLKVEPDWSRLPANLHPGIRHLLERCLEKARRDRFAGISDARVEIERALADPRGVLNEARTDDPHARPGRRVRFAAAALGAVLVSALAAGLTVWHFNPRPPALVMHFVDELPLGPPTTMLSLPSIDISRDGTRIVYSAGEEMPRQQFYLRAIGDADARVIQGPAGIVGLPRFSPDGQWIAYFAPPELVRVPVGGGTSETIVGNLRGPVRGFSWDGGRLVYALSDGIYDVAETGGTARLLIPAGERESFASPHRLPGRDAVLFSAAAGTSPSDWDAGNVVVQSLTSGKRTVIARGRDARYLPSGHILYAQGTALYAVAFDFDRLEVVGAPVRVVDNGIVRPDTGVADAAQYAVSDTGSLVYLENVPGVIARTFSRRSLVWVDRAGERKPIDLPANDYSLARISPDGRRVVLVIGKPGAQRHADLWVFDLDTDNVRQLTFGVPANAPVWSHDSERIYFRGFPGGLESVYSIAADGGEPEIIASGTPQFATPVPWSLTPDGKTLLVLSSFVGMRIDALGLGPERDFRRLLSAASSPTVSPDGAWMAYVDLTGEPNVSIRPYPDVARQAYPVARGHHPAFSQDGRELYFVDNDALRSVPLEYEPAFRIGEPREVFRGPYTFSVEGRAWDAHPDGERFLVLLDAEAETSVVASQAEPQRVHIVVNWIEELRRRVPEPARQPARGAR